MIKKIIILCLILAAIPVMTFAWNVGDPLVPCGTIVKSTPCTLCHLYTLAQNIMGFLMWQVVPIIAIFAFSWAGFKILISGDNPGLRSEGFGIMKKTLVGILIVFSSWIIINEVLLFFGGQQGTDAQGNKIGGVLSNPWNAVNCKLPPAPTVAGFNNGPSYELSQLMSVVKTAVPSIQIVQPTTDSHIPATCNPLDTNLSNFNNANACQHAKDSCHYGGKNCPQLGSFAFDFTATSVTDPIYVAVQGAIPAQAFIQFELLSAPHGHVSIGNIYGCGCQ